MRRRCSALQGTSRGVCVTEAAIPTGSDDVELARQIDERRRRYEMPEAEAAAREALGRFPDSVDLALAHGRVLLATHRAVEAAQVFLRAEQVAPEDDRPAAWHVAALSRQRLFDEAIAAGVKALGRLPGSSLIRVTLGRVFLDSSRPDEALKYFADAVAMAPNDATATSWHATGLAELYRWTEAQEAIHKGIERDPNAAKTRLHLGKILFQDRQHNDALKCFDIVLSRNPEHPQALERKSTR